MSTIPKWIDFNGMIGEVPKPTPELPSIPVIDDDFATASKRKSTGMASRLLEEQEFSSALRSIFGSDEVSEMVKKASIAAKVASCDSKQVQEKRSLAKYRRDLSPIVQRFRSDLRPYSERVPDELFDRVLDSMAQFVVNTVEAA